MRVVCKDNFYFAMFSCIFSRTLAAFAVKKDIELNYNGGYYEDQDSVVSIHDDVCCDQC